MTSRTRMMFEMSVMSDLCDMIVDTVNPRWLAVLGDSGLVQA
jgi:hypothetical protein